LKLVVWAAVEGSLGQVVLGMDAARRKYWHGYGGEPGMGFLLREFVPMLMEQGLTQADIDQIFIANPAGAYSFVPTAR
jgi:phosphotriesterase-related protein